MNDRVSKASFPAMLEMFKGQIALALPKHINPDRMTRIALSCFRANPKLAECKPESVFAAVVQASQLGLEPGLNGRAYLVPYKVNKKVGDGWESHYEAQFIPGWRGLVELANRTGRASVWTGSIFKGQKFTYSQGDSPSLSVEQSDEDDPNLLTHVYAVGRIRGSEFPIIELWSTEKIKKHRDRFNKVGKAHYSYENFEAYARKIPLLQILKYLPGSVELETAIGFAESAGNAAQGINISDAIAGSWSPVAVVENEPPQQDESRTESGRKKPQAKQGSDAPPVTPTSSAKLADSQRAAIFAKADAYEITSAEIAKAFAVENVVDIGANRFAEVMEWLSDPSTPPNLG